MRLTGRALFYRLACEHCQSHQIAPRDDLGILASALLTMISVLGNVR